MSPPGSHRDRQAVDPNFEPSLDRAGGFWESLMPEKNRCHQLVLPGVLYGNLTFIAKKLALSKTTASVFFFLFFSFLVVFNVRPCGLNHLEK